MASNASILVVDDDASLRQLLLDTLEAIGYRAVAAADGVEALETLRRHERTYFDLLLTDIRMPNMDGFALLRKIRRLYPALPVVFITGVFSEEAMASASPDGFLAKPFRIARLEELIEHTLAARHSDRPPSPPRRVLIHVRQPELRESLAEAMAFSNYLPFSVTEGDEAIEELQRGEFDALITGTDEIRRESRLIKRLNEDYPTLPMLLAGEKTDREPPAEIRNRIEGIVGKPVRAGELIRMLDRTVAHNVDNT